MRREKRSGVDISGFQVSSCKGRCMAERFCVCVLLALFYICITAGCMQSTVAILAQGTSWAVAVTQAFCAPGFKLSMACGLQLLCYKPAIIKRPELYHLSDVEVTAFHSGLFSHHCR